MIKFRFLSIFLVTAQAIAQGPNEAKEEVVAPKVTDRSPEWQKRMMIFPQREELPDTLRFSDGRNVIHMTDVFLELGYSTEEFAKRLGPPDVHLPPRLVCGEGADAENGTVVRVLNRYGMLQSQFAAFPPQVKGGVQVVALRGESRDWIAAAPFAAEPREIRVFDDRGLLQTVIALPPEIATPVVLASGRFLGGEDEQILVAPRDQTHTALPIGLWSAQGKALARWQVARPPGRGTVQFTTLPETDRDRLLAYFPAVRAAMAYQFSDKTPPQSRAFLLPQADEQTVLSASAYDSSYLLAGRNDDVVLSKLDLLDEAGRTKATQDVGRRENSFWNLHMKQDVGYVRRGGYGQGGNNNVPDIWRAYDKTRDPKLLLSEDPLQWVGDRFGAKPLKMGELLFPYWSVWLNTWTKVGEIKDAQGLSAYSVVAADGKTENDSSIYKGDVSIDRQLLLHSRVFFWLSAANVRGLGMDAEHFVGATSLHELGAAMDYKAANISQFVLFLKSRFGTIEALNSQCKTPFKSWAEVDPPRGQNRGEWDTVVGREKPFPPYFDEWAEYSWNMQLATRFADAKRDSLLAGFAPELIKNHRPGFGKDMGIAGLTLGTSTGGSVYSPLPGVYHEIWQVISPNTSGQWNFSYGEYQNNELPYEYTRLKWQWKQGLLAANMQEPISPQMLAADGEPRPGQIGGVGQVRPVMVNDGPQGPTRFNIAQIGVGAGRNGLLKSLTSEGTFEGSTYVVPFHAKVQSVALAAPQSFSSVARQELPVAKLSLHNDQVEVTFSGRGAAGSKLTLGISQRGAELPGARQTFALGAAAQNFRYAFRNHMTLHDVKLLVQIEGADAAVADFHASWQQDLVAARAGIRYGTQHRGGVSFDLLDRAMVASRAPRGKFTAQATPTAAELPPDAQPPTWTKGRIEVRFPLDDEIKATGAIPCLDPDFRTHFAVFGAKDDDAIAGYRLYDATSGEKLAESTDRRFPLPPLPPLQARSFRVAAFDRAGNESKDGPRIAFTTPAILDIGPKKTGQPELVTLVNRASKPDGTSVAGWVTLGKTSEKVGSWTGENILNSEYRALENDAVLKVTLPNGHYRISLLITDGPSPTAKVLLDGVLVWHFPTRHWTTTVEPFLAQVTKGAMELTLPRAFGLLGVVIVPEQPGQAPQWTVANPMPVVESLEFQRISDEKAPHFDFNKASLRLRWPAATGARSYRVIVNNEPRYVINLTAVELEKLPIDTPLDIRIDAVDRDGRITSSKTSARKLTPGCSALASCFRGSL